MEEEMRPAFQTKTRTGRPVDRQAATTLLMVRPAHFRYHEQSAASNHFQKEPEEDVHTKVLAEFDELVERLRMASIDVLIHEEEPDIASPDAIFPNNWFSTHENGRFVLYPMMAVHRRKEREGRTLDLLKKSGYDIVLRTDHTAWEEQSKFLEGTGSMVFDRQNRKAYACLSPRTDRNVLEHYCSEIGFDPVVFYASDTNGERFPIYHTNVLLSIAEGFAVICSEAFDDPIEESTVKDMLRMGGKELIEISAGQMRSFAGNVLQVLNTKDQLVTLMSSAAYRSFNEEQLERIRAYGEVLHSPIPTIEAVGGGSVRCMLAEIFLPKGTE